jgi:hypothetical protein
MLFEIKITDPLGHIMLNDIFFMDSINSPLASRETDLESTYKLKEPL